MNLQIFKYCCEPGRHEFRAVEIPLDTYGKFLLRDETGVLMAYLDAISDNEYAELSAMIAHHPMTSGLNANKRADVLQRIYGKLVCDPAENNYSFSIEQHSQCPVCLSTVMYAWDEERPIEFVEVDIPPVTHIFWRSMTETEKSAKLDDRLRELFR